MSNIEEISIDSDKEQSTQFNIHQINKNIDQTNNLNTINEEKNEGGQTSTPARPTIGEAQSQNPELTEGQQEKEQACWKSRKFIVILTILLILATTLVIWAAVNAAKGPRKTIKAKKSFIIHTQGFRAVKIVGESLVMIDQTRFGSGKQLQIMVLKTEGQKAVDTTGRALQQKDKSHQTTITIRDSETDTLISVTSKQLDIKMVVNPTVLLQYVLNAQIEQDPDTNYQQPPSQNLISSQEQLSLAATLQIQSQLPDHPVRTYNFYQYDYILEQELKNNLKSSNKDAVINNQATVDLKYDSLSHSYRIEEQQSLSDEKKNSSASFANVVSVPQIKDFINENEVAQASNVLLENILRSAKEFLRQNLEEIQLASGIVLPEKDNSLGETSIYKDQPEDLLKLCQNLDEQTLRCFTPILSSTLVQVSDPDFPVYSKSNIVAFIDQ